MKTNYSKNFIETVAEINGKTIDEVYPHKCLTCSYHYHDNFCMLNLYYVSDDHTCGRWTDEEIKFDYDRIYRLCKSYIEICDMYTDGERLKEKYPEKMKWENFSNCDFFLNCCLNDLHREMSLWKTRR